MVGHGVLMSIVHVPLVILKPVTVGTGLRQKELVTPLPALEVNGVLIAAVPFNNVTVIVQVEELDTTNWYC